MHCVRSSVSLRNKSLDGVGLVDGGAADTGKNERPTPISHNIRGETGNYLVGRTKPRIAANRVLRIG